MKRESVKNGADLKAKLIEQYSLDSVAALVIVETAAAALDQALAAEELIKITGLTTTGTRGDKPHPAVNISRDARLRLLAALRALNVDLQG